MSAGAFNIFRLLGDFIHVASIFLLFAKMRSTRSCSGTSYRVDVLGLSLKSQLLYGIVYVTRYLDLFYFTRFDLLHIYNFLMKCLFISSQAAVLYYSWFRFRATYNGKLDTVRLEFIIIPCLLLAFFFETAPKHGGTILFLREVRHDIG